MAFRATREDVLYTPPPEDIERASTGDARLRRGLSGTCRANRGWASGLRVDGQITRDDFGG